MNETGLLATGVWQILRERMRQIVEEDFDAAHDDAHPVGDLGRAALCYLVQAILADVIPTQRELLCKIVYRPADHVNPFVWPFASALWKPAGRHPPGAFVAAEDSIRCLEKAGALIAAEIDRRARAEQRRAS